MFRRNQTFRQHIQSFIKFEWCSGPGLHLQFSLTNESINELHQKSLQWVEQVRFEREKYTKDIELREYNILDWPRNHSRVLNNLKIGIKVETDKSEALKFINQYTMLMRAYFGEIKSVSRHSAMKKITSNVLLIL